MKRKRVSTAALGFAGLLGCLLVGFEIKVNHEPTGKLNVVVIVIAAWLLGTIVIWASRRGK
jgi:hypothetical protein